MTISSLKTRNFSAANKSMIYAVFMVFVFILPLIRTLKLSPTGGSIFMESVAAIIYSMATCGSLVMLFHYGVMFQRTNLLADADRLLPMTCISQGMAFIFFHAGLMTPNVFFMTTIGIQTLTTWLGFRFALKDYKMSDRYSKAISLSAPAVMIFYGIISSHLRNFYSLDQIIIGSAIFQGILHGLGLIAVATWFSIHPSHKLDPDSIWRSHEYRQGNAPEKISSFNGMIIAGIAQCIAVSLTAYSYKIFELGYPWVTAITCQLLFLPAFIHIWREVSSIGADNEALRDVSKLTLASARQMLLRHSKKRDSWAATLGLKTSSITIEHDAEGLLKEHLPATLLRIRSEEANNFVNQLVVDQTIDIHLQSDKITCVLDPEKSLRPCLDSLKLCASLYLDGGALLERRLANLISLFPIVNPGLAEILKPDTTLSILKRARWFFYFDYSWTDQSVVSYSSHSRYRIQVDQLSPAARMDLVQHMRKTHALGNYVWLGLEAHSKILQEAPILGSITTPHPITGLGGKDLLVFSIKFEELVPRLQRYYGLDDFRRRIIDFEPSHNTQKLLNLLTLQINNAHREADLARITEVIASFKWRGFKEKDQALSLLLSIFDKAIRNKNNQNLNELSRQNLLAKLTEAIAGIGYPSQIINQAYVSKAEQRHLANLQTIALDPNHIRHLESWATISNLDYNRMQPSELNSIEKIIKIAISRADIFRVDAAHARIIDCVLAIFKARSRKGETLEIDLLMDALEKLVCLKVSCQSFSLALDALAFVGQLKGESIQIPPAIHRYFDGFTVGQQDNPDNWRQSFVNRWLEYKTTTASKIKEESKNAS